IHIDDAIGIRAAHVEDVDPLQILFHVHEFRAIRRGELAGNSRSFASCMRLELIDLALVVHGASPGLKWNLVQHVLRQRRGTAIPTARLLSGHGTDPGFSIRPARSGSGRSGRSALSAAAAAALLLLALLALLSRLSLLRIGTCDKRQSKDDDC